MKKASLLLIPALVLCAAAPAVAMDADELIAKSIEATGGLDKIQAVKTMKTTGKILMMGMEFPFVTYHARPAKIRIESNIQGMDFVQAYDGEVGWMINPMTGSQDPQKMPESQTKSFKLNADLDGVLVDYEKKGYTVEYIGTDEVEGTAVHHMKLDTNDNIIMELYFDAEYFLAIKVTTKGTEEGQEFESETYFSDFKEAGDRVTAHSIETRMGGQTVNQIMIEAIEFGLEIDDSIFPMPEVEGKTVVKPDEN